MIKRIHEITLRDILLLEETKSADHFKRFSFVPFWIISKRVDQLVSDIFNRIGEDTTDQLMDKFEELFEYRKLQILEALYNAAYSAFFMQGNINVFKTLIDKEIVENKALSTIVEKVKQYTGIEIKEPVDFERFSKKINFLKDKFEERYSKAQKKEQKKLDITEIIYSYFHFLSEPFNEKMRFLTFVTMKKLADQKIKDEKNKDNG